MIWDIINTVINPEMKSKIRSGEIFEGDIMKYIYSVFNTNELKVYNNFIKINSEKIEKFLDYIGKNFLVYKYPKYLVLCNLEVATQVHSTLSIPAYTNERRIIFTPEIEVWKKSI